MSHPDQRYPASPIEGVEFYGIQELTLEYLHDELADIFIAHAEEDAAYYLDGAA